MNFIKLNYFKNGKNICGADFELPTKEMTLNLSQIESLSELKTFRLPFSGKKISLYAVLKTNTGDIFFIRKKEYYKTLNNIFSYGFKRH